RYHCDASHSTPYTATTSLPAYHGCIAVTRHAALPTRRSSDLLTATVTEAGTPVEGVQVGFSGELNLRFFSSCQQSVFFSDFVVTDRKSTRQNSRPDTVSRAVMRVNITDTNKDYSMDEYELTDT